MKEPFEPGTFLHTRDGSSRLRRETHPDVEVVILITRRLQRGESYIYDFTPFHYYPDSLWRLIQVYSDTIQGWISSPVLKKECWQPVDVSKGEVAE